MYNGINRYFSQNVKHYRFMRNYSQEKLGEKSRLSTHYISDIEQGKYSPTIPPIECIAKALGIETNLILLLIQKQIS